MKKQVLLLSLLGVVIAGCDNKSEPAGSSSGSVLSAPADYVGAAAKAQQTAAKTADTLALSSAIQLFGGEQGRYPTDLNELVAKKYLREIPQPPRGMEIQYDAKTGTVKVVAE
ncbi:MAG: hypothetical protein H0X66_11400 [Verrucomicrobia bacterium]|nr:hypothetical protein [Verrucomicrobiota bacterium]